MEKLRGLSHEPRNEGFTVETFFEKLPLLREQILEIRCSLPKKILIAQISDYDLLNIYAEWVYRKKTTEETNTNGYIFEILCQCYVRQFENQSELSRQIKDILLFLNQPRNNYKIWGIERSNPDDISFTIYPDSLTIDAIYESKVSVHSLVRSKDQRQQSKIMICDLVDCLNGCSEAESKIKTDEGRRLIAHSREMLKVLVDKPIKIARTCKYTYLLPQDEKHQCSDAERRNLEVINIPLGINDVHAISALVIGFFRKHFP